MRIGVNATCLNDRPSGAKHRFLGIYGALFRELSDAEFVIFEPSDCNVSGWFQGEQNVMAYPTPLLSTDRIGRYAAGLGFWQKTFAGQLFDLFEGMHLPMVRPRGGAAILTVHDVRGLSLDKSIVFRKAYANVLRHALRQADHVVTVSASMRQEILAFYPHTPVSFVHNGVDSSLFKKIDASKRGALLAKYNLPSDFVLAVGHFEQRKNYARLIDAVALLQHRGIDCPLVIVGNDSGEGDSLARQIASLGLNSKITLLKGLTDDELCCVYLAATLFVFPSLYEGFGVPILEAMAAGRPVVMSELPVFREITQDRGYYFNPYDVNEIANAIGFLLTSSDLRKSMIDYGYERIKDFSFDMLAKAMANVYRQVV